MLVTPAKTSRHYSIQAIQEEARQLLQKGLLHRQQPIYTLCQYIPARVWPEVEAELERHDYLLRDRLIELCAKEVWLTDD